MQPTTLWDEATAAVRGSWALLRGDRSAPSSFDFSLRGLAGSFIVFVFLVTASSFLASANPIWPNFTAEMFATVVLYIGQMGGVALALRRMQRSDGFVPFLVADNWTQAVVGVLMIAAALMGFGIFVLSALVVGMLVIKVNAARLIVTLTPWQIVIVFAAQIVGAFIALVVILLFVTPNLPPVSSLPA